LEHIGTRKTVVVNLRLRFNKKGLWKLLACEVCWESFWSYFI